MVDFKVSGPYKVPFKTGRGGGKTFDRKAGIEMLKEEEVADNLGCYVFAMRTGRAIVPCYVGQTAKTSFARECFTPDKLNKYHVCAVEYKRSTPVMFLLSPPRGRGKVNKKQIDALENFLIENFSRVNPDLINKRGNKKPLWSIAGVVRSQGKPNTAAQKLKKMLKL